MKRTFCFLASLMALASHAQLCFNSPVSYPNTSSQCLISADLDNDGYKDLITGSNLGISVYNNIGGTLSTPTIYLLSQNSGTPRSMTACDINGDGYKDLAFTTDNGGKLFVHLNNGTGNLQPALTYSGMGFGSVASSDFNEDGKDDLAVSGTSLNVLFGTASGTLTGPSTFSGQAGFLAAADFNGDGNADVASGNAGAALVRVWYGTGLGGFAPVTTFSAELSVYSLSTADLNADGRSDLVVTYGKLAVLLAAGNNSFMSMPTVTLNNSICMWEISFADVNGDGFNDLVIPQVASKNVCVRLGDGNGNFNTEVQVAASQFGKSTAVVALDLNNNGRPDIASIHPNEVIVSTDCIGVGIEESFAEKLLVFPNPAKDFVEIRCETPLSELIIVDMQGRECVKISGGCDRFSVDELEAGCYFLHAKTNNTVFKQKLIITK